MKLPMVLLVGLAAGMGPLHLALVGRVAPVLPGLLLSVATLGWALLLLRRGGAVRARVILAVLLAAGIPVHYASTGAVIEELRLPVQDEAVARAEAALLGWAFPGGHVSIALDRSAAVGPSTAVGRVVTEFLQVAYFSYYFWGLALLLLLAARLLRRRHEAAWTALRMFLCAWVGAYLVNYLLYLLVPVVGPQLHFPEAFEHPLTGLGLTPHVRAFIHSQQATPPDCFPSGHVALSWIAAVAALRLAPRYGRLAAAAAAAITVATLVLRYHYVMDLLAAVPLVLLGLAWGGFLTSRPPPTAAGVLRARTP